MDLGRRIAASSVALAALTMIGVIGYMVIEDWSLLDATYMTIVTFTTVGYDEVRPLSSGGKVFTIFMMLSGVGVMLYLLTNVVSLAVEQQVLRSFVRRRRMKTRLAGLKHHFIICGLGRVGREVAEAIQRESMQFIVVDRDPLAIAEADELGYLYVQGDATLDEVLISAGIKSARGLVAAAGSDSDNVFITLSAKGLNSSLTVVARATNTQTEDKLLIAGASKVILPYRIGGRRMAMSALRPLAVDFFDSIFNSDGEKGLRLAEIQVADRSPLAGLTIEKCVSDQGIQVLALRRGDDEMIVNPKGDVVLKPGDGLVLVGHNSQLEPLEREDRS